jgi:ribosomal protein S18 acetylase RimI-like enzyme
LSLAGGSTTLVALDELQRTRRTLETSQLASLVLDDLRVDDLATLGWSGTRSHIRSVADYLARVPSGEVEYLVIRGVEGTPVAKAGILYSVDVRLAEIMQLATHGQLQGLGLGTALIGAAEARMRNRGVGVSRVGVEDDNPRARALYERLGYREVGRKPESWEAERPDGSLFEYHTFVTEMDKAL